MNGVGEVLRAMLDEQLLRRRELLLGGNVVYTLSRAGCALAMDHDVIDRAEISSKHLWRRLEVSDLTLLHELEVVDLRIAFEKAATGRCSVSTYLAQRRFVTEAGKRIFPDGVLTVAGGGKAESRFCLELDRGTEPLRRIVTKVADYSSLAGSGLRRPFRVLFVVPSFERRNNIAWLLREEFPQLPNFILVGEKKDVLHDPLGAVFLTPGALRAVNLSAATPTVASGEVYRRSKERDELIKKEARLVSLHRTCPVKA